MAPPAEGGACRAGEIPASSAERRRPEPGATSWRRSLPPAEDLDERRAAEAKALTPFLAKVFESKGVHREALAALKLFQEAAEREEATAELARNLLRYFFRARYDQGLRFVP